METKFFSKIAGYDITKHIIEFGYGEVYINDNLNLELLPVLFHEYIHFYVQFNSLFHLEGYLYYFLFINKLSDLIELKGFETVIPFNEYRTTLSDDSNVIKAMKSYQNWNERQGEKFLRNTDINTTFREFKFATIDSKNEIISLPWDPLGVNMSSVVIEHEGLTASLSFGELILNEGLAFIMESVLSNRLDHILEDSPDLKYQLLMKFMLDRNYSLLAFLIIVDISLQHPSPGFKFFQLTEKYDHFLKKFPKNNYTASHLNKLKRLYKNEINNPDIVKYLHYLEDLTNIIKKDVNNHPHFKFILDKFMFGIDRIKNKTLPHYSLILFEFAGKSVKDSFFDLLKFFPPPLIHDVNTKNDGKYVFFYLENHKDYLQKDDYIRNNLFHIGLHYFFQYIIFEKIGNGCPVYSYCYHSFKSDNCKNKIWELGKLKKPCEFGTASSFFNLK